MCLVSSFRPKMLLQLLLGAQKEWHFLLCIFYLREHLLLGLTCFYMNPYYGGLNKDGPHRPIASSTIRKWSLVGLSVPLLEEVYHSGVGSEVSEAQAGPSGSQFNSCCLQIQMQNSQLLLRHRVCLHAMLSYHDDNG